MPDVQRRCSRWFELTFAERGRAALLRHWRATLSPRRRSALVLAAVIAELEREVLTDEDPRLSRALATLYTLQRSYTLASSAMAGSGVPGAEPPAPRSGLSGSSS